MIGDNRVVQRARLVALFAVLSGCLPERIDAYIDDLREPLTEGSSSSTGTVEESSSGSSSTSGPSTESGSMSESASATSESSTTGETTDATTAEPTPVCGNGVVEPFGPDPEECDVADPKTNLRCHECLKDRVVFVSSTKHAGYKLGGVGLADSVCFNRAGDVGLPDPLNYRAWISDSEVDARDRIKPGRGRLVLVNGLVVAQSWEALLAGELERPIDTTEKGEIFQTYVWTGTRPDGTKVPDSTHCGDWMVLEEGYVGETVEMTGEWTLSQGLSNPDSCVSSWPFYCFEQGD